MTTSQSAAPVSTRRSRRAWVYGVYGFNLIIITWFWWHGSHLELGTLHGVLTVLGRLAALVSAYAALWQLLLIGRMPIIKQAFGMGEELNLHRWNGYAAILLLLAHIILTTVGYALTVHVNIWHQFVDFIINYEGILAATVGSVLMIGLVVLSVAIVRRQLKYETWYLVHLSSYLAIILGFSHQLSTGSDLLKQPGFVIYWWALYIITAALVVGFRFVQPLIVSWWQDFRVERVVAEAKGINSIYVSGRHLDHFKFVPGQFAIWHFLAGPTWWQGHPFSLSGQPGQPGLRLTVKTSGDYTRSLPRIKPGTRVIVEGPFGNFTSARLQGTKALLIAGGIGLTPLISMLGQLTATGADIVMIYAAQIEADIALRAELEAYVKAQAMKLHYIIEDPTYPGLTGRLDRAKLRKLVADLETREVFLCGPIPMMAAVTEHLVAEGVAPDHIYTEKFSY